MSSTTSMFLNIITPLTRAENLDLMYKSIEKSVIWEYQWLIVVDAKTVMDGIKIYPPMEKNIKYYAYPSDGGIRGISGNPQRNFALDKIKKGYVHFLDDDNILHPRFGAVLSLIENFPDCGVVTNQVWKNGNIRLAATPRNMKVTYIDTAQWTVPVDIIGDLRWETHNYCADGVFIQTLFEKYPKRFIFLPEGVAYYNYLR